MFTALKAMLQVNYSLVLVSWKLSKHFEQGVIKSYTRRIILGAAQTDQSGKRLEAVR